MSKIGTLSVILLMCACTRTVYVPQVRTEYVTSERVDSLFVRDSVFITERLCGDTVYQIKDRWHTAYKLEVRVDTVLRCDSIPYPVEVVRTEYRTPVPVTALAWLGALAVTAYLCFWRRMRLPR